MAKYMFDTLLPSESCLTPATKNIDLKGKGIISKITAILKATSAGTEQTANPAANVTKIEIVDGSTVMVSLSGRECQALDFYNSKFMPDNFVCDADNVMAFATFNINFGRKLWDTALALDPSKFDNPQLKITHNALAADSAADAATLEVYAHEFDEKQISPVGYLQPVEHYSYTCAAAASVETVDLPMDLAIRQMIINTYGDGYYPWQIANKIKIKEGKASRVPYDFSTSAWLKFINQRYPVAVEKCYLAGTTSYRHLYCAPSFTIDLHTIQRANAGTVYTQDANSPVPIHYYGEAATQAVGQTAGWNPHGAFPIPFGDQDDMDDWYNPANVGSLKMEITAGTAATSGSTKIVLEQLKKY
jgi:hypothetical protein